MFKRFSTSYMVLLYLLDQILTAVALYAAALLRIRLPYGTAVPWEMARPPVAVFAIAAVIWSAVFVLLAVYDADGVFRAVDEFQLVLLASALAAFTLAGVLYVTYRDLPRFTFLYFSLLNPLLLIGYRGLFRLYFRLRRSRLEGMTPVLIVGTGPVAHDAARALEAYRYMGLDPIGFLARDEAERREGLPDLPVLGTLEQAASVVEAHDVAEVVIALQHQERRSVANLVAELQAYPVRIKVVPDFFDLAFPQARVGIFAGIPMIGLREPAIDALHRFFKRLFDLVIAVPAVVILSPLMAIIAAAIRLESEGPVIFAQQRVGENGALFSMLKFRSMVKDAEVLRDKVVRLSSDGRVIHKTRHDPRVTRVGRILRRTSLDELPQLLNVIKGEMSLVGPRPELPWLVERYEPWQRQRFAVPPGITGWWQVNGRSDDPMHLHTEDDLYYIQNYSVLLDLQILWRTVGVVVKGKGAF